MQADFCRKEPAMFIHDWSRVRAGIFHDFHQEWIGAVKRG